MDNNLATIQIRMRKLGLLISEARQVKRRSIEECAEALDISAETYQAVERGKQALSLPELETLAYFLDVPLDHFWGNETLQKKAIDQRTAHNLKDLRNRVLVTRLRMAMKEKGLTLEDLARMTSIPIGNLQLYETGRTQIPLPELEILAKHLEIRIQDVFDQHGPVGEWYNRQQATQKFLNLPHELQNFIIKPVNQPYLQAALRLSEMNVEKLRTLAEGLIEITF